ncbi:MAG TPA: hypothetical protein VJ890_12255 [Vineibacter sp.]|nr:hypothetical protein [Vineibacter sp.]
MTGPRRANERLFALFLLGVLAITPPLLSIFNNPTRILGLPALYFYLFACWAALILLVALAVRRRALPDESVGPSGGTAGPPASLAAEEPRDA